MTINPRGIIVCYNALAQTAFFSVLLPAIHRLLWLLLTCCIYIHHVVVCCCC
ncbi:hypothetical protein BKA57DRAFT_468210 [Linnemannia elongata]|nr:hypothetical protein BKA57DRAFT_468210 [Linnemannia elongata]KAK5821193.1 hypothetical protein F5H01DRAFT_340175 [Linnemannia elongata]